MLRITEVLGFFKDEKYWEWVIRVGKKEARRIGKIAMGIGSNVDEAIKADVRIDKKKVRLKTKEALNCFSAYTKWLDEYQVTHIKVGERFYNEELQVTGEPDLILGDTLIDVKCSNKIRLEYWLQTEFYARNVGCKFKAILRLDKNLADYEYVKLPLSDQDWDACLSAITLYRFFNKPEENSVEESEVTNVCNSVTHTEE